MSAQSELLTTKELPAITGSAQVISRKVAILATARALCAPSPVAVLARSFTAALMLKTGCRI